MERIRFRLSFRRNTNHQVKNNFKSQIEYLKQGNNPCFFSTKKSARWSTYVIAYQIRCINFFHHTKYILLVFRSRWVWCWSWFRFRFRSWICTSTTIPSTTIVCTSCFSIICFGTLSSLYIPASDIPSTTIGFTSLSFFVVWFCTSIQFHHPIHRHRLHRHLVHLNSRKLYHL